MDIFLSTTSKDTKAQVKDFNTVLNAGKSHFSGSSVDLVVTSPPYGDSVTTVAYSQFSWLSNVWLGLDKSSSSKLDSDLMGGRKTSVNPLDFYKMLECKAIKTVLEKISYIFMNKETNN